MRYLVHIVGAMIFCTICIILFFQLADYKIDGDQVLSFYFASAEDKDFYNQILDKSVSSEIDLRDFREYFSPSWSNDPFGTIKILSKLGETHPPLYYKLLGLWEGMTPTISIQWSRFMSLLIVILSSVIAGLWSRDLTKKSLFFWPGALFILSSYHVIEQSGLIRMHTTTLFIATLFTWSSFRLLNKPSRVSLVIHHLSLLCGLFSTFLFSIYAAPFVFYRIYKSSRILVTIFRYVLIQLPFILWGIFYGISQLINIPYGSFSGLSGSAHGMALEGWKLHAYADLFLYLTPFAILLLHHSVTSWTVYFVVLFFSWYSFRSQPRALTLFFFIPFVSVFLGEIALDSVASQLASGRGLNFFLVPLLMIFILSLNKLENRWRYSGILIALIITSIGFRKNYYYHQGFLKKTPQLISEVVVQELNKAQIDDENLVVLMNRSFPQTLKSALYLRDYPAADVYFFENMSDLSNLKLDLYREVVIISNPKFFDGKKQNLKKYFTDKAYKLKMDLEKPSDHLLTKDFALIFSYRH